MTRLTRALKGELTPGMVRVASMEGVAPELVGKGVADGSIVILRNSNRKSDIVEGIGKGLRTKVSASVGLYGSQASVPTELMKVQAALDAGTNAIMDLSVSGDINGLRRQVLAAASKPVGTLPLYQALAEAKEKYNTPAKMKVDELFGVIERHAADGVDFLALHCGTTMEIVKRAKKDGRVDPLVSYGGSHLIGWMLYNQMENPLYTGFDRILEIAGKYDVTISLADGMRPGCLADSLDGAQVQELVLLGELVRRAREAGVQVMVKGPGHVPLHQLKATVVLQKSLCKGAPYFVFGPVVTDIAAGYDHISASIGGAVSAWAGAEFLCYVTASEHIGLPDINQVREGVVAARIAAHAGDLAKGLPGAAEWDLEISRARKLLDWEKQIRLAVDPERARYLREERSDGNSEGCAMCGKYCAMKVVSEYLGSPRQNC
ncbi:hydroxymethylpyrimidine phosphate synthase ThiC [Desulfocucumis palustris]|uniref:Phosphomethylpyrimidine synthase n=1 Tax=Desulfocucumis palustris TaxID=1898651 RepID=A0A2L2X8Q4_9FIRM|nr:phosphomethylpyrimidine synthase ThiC [Desulfocucumis palustris]GBF32607.1 hydroxymethylpyrimidine phosphate synthase ThiC [Desulfocucumis palustris]